MKDKSKRIDRVLSIIVEAYIDKAEPIGSGFVSKKLGLSSATVRNIMADLESQGYIFHPHTSAGRIPTDKGYRYYVDRLMSVKGLTTEEEKDIEKLFAKKVNKLEDALVECSRALSHLTNYVSVILYPKLVESEFQRIELIPIDKNKLVALMINSSGVIKESIIELEEDININELSKISKFLNEELAGLGLGDIEGYLKRKIYLEKDSFYHMFKRALEIIDLTDFLKEEDMVFYDGTARMLDYPEFRNPENIKHLLEAFEDKEDLVRVLGGDLNFDGMRILIGRENDIDSLKDFAVIMTNYKVKNFNAGSIGVIGPKRMSYTKAVSSLKRISDQLNKALAGY